MKTTNMNIGDIEVEFCVYDHAMNEHNDCIVVVTFMRGGELLEECELADLIAKNSDFPNVFGNYEENCGVVFNPEIQDALEDARYFWKQLKKVAGV